jgi:predicted transcriptional regulator
MICPFERKEEWLNTLLYSIHFGPNGPGPLMLQPQELVVAKLLPTIRARLARELLRTYKMKQIDVARSMGITQAAVSHYNTQTRGVDQEMLHLFPEIKPFVHNLAEGIAEGMTLSDQIASVSQFCSTLMTTARFCEYHKGMGDIDPHCTACFPSPPRP